MVHKSANRNFREGDRIRIDLLPGDTDALPSQHRATPPVPESEVSGEELGRVGPSVATAWQFDGVGHARSDRGLAGAAHGSAWAVSFLFESGDRDRASTTLGVWSTVAANGRPVALHHDLTWGEPSGS